VKLTVYALSGKVVTEIEKEPGEDVFWDGSDSNGNLQEGGLYLYIFEAGSEKVKGTAVLAK